MGFITTNLEQLKAAKSKFSFLISEIRKINPDDEDLPNFGRTLSQLSDFIENSKDWDDTLSTLPKEAEQQILASLDKYHAEPESYSGVLALSSFVSMCNIVKDLQNPEKLKAILSECTAK